MKVYDGCPACRYELEKIGPVHGPEKAPDPALRRWSMTPREWVGEGPIKYWGN